MSPQQFLFIATTLVFTLAARTQDPKVAKPLPSIDLDIKSVQPVVPAPTLPKVPRAQIPVAQQSERPRAEDTVTLPNGRRFRAGVPQAQVLFDRPNEDAIWASGNSYKASFTRSGFTFVPYFGSTAPKNYPVATTLESARFGPSLMPLSLVAPYQQGNSAILDHGAVIERYDLAMEHVEQKFIVPTAFAGGLTLTFRLDTELQAGRDAAGLRFGNSLGYVGYTNAVLIDARGRRLPMQTDYADGRITLHASASVVADAMFPITVDPVWARFATVQSSYELFNPDAAYSSISGHYLVIWTRFFSTIDRDVFAVSVDADGNVVNGSSSVIDNTADPWDDSRVASCGSHFLVVASVTGTLQGIWGRTRGVGVPYTVGPPFQISGTESGYKSHPDVGGEFDGPTNFCVVWSRQYSQYDYDIHYRMVTSSGAVLGPALAIDNSAMSDYRPRIAKSDGRLPSSEQVWPIVWQRENSLFDHDIRGARVRWDGTLVTSPFVIDDSADDDESPTVSSLTDNLGSKYFLVAYTTDNPGGVVDTDIYMRAFRDGTTPVETSGAYLAALENLTAAERARPQLAPQTDSDGCRFTVSYLEEFRFLDGDAYVTTLHLTPSLAVVEPRVGLAITGFDTNSASLVASRSGGGSATNYLTVWNERGGNPWYTNINGATYRGITPGGGFATRSTGCGGLRISFAGGSQIPSPGNTVRFDLSGPPGGFMFFGSPTGPLMLCPPAPCSLGATITVVLPGTSLSLAIPCSSNLVGERHSVQGAAFLSPGGCPVFSQLVTSDTVDMTIR